jgi:predicted nucleotidyltransferase
MLIEIARKKKGYVPELSFGTHFFQDLVESAIHYLPLYPDDDGIIFMEEFLLGSPNVLPDLVPEFSHLQNVIHVIDVGATAGTALQVFMNGDRDQALAVLADSPPVAGANAPPAAKQPPVRKEDSHWRWRMSRVEQLAERMDPDRFGVKAMFLFGSTKDATAGPQSDIDLLVHFQGTPAQEKELLAWLEGWSLCLSEENLLRTGLKTSGLLDVHLITDEDIARRTSFASKIGSITDPPRPLPLRKSVKT